MLDKEFNQKAINDVYKNAHLALQSISDLLPEVDDEEIKKEDTRFIRLPYKFMIRSFCGKNWCADPLPFRVLGKSLTSPADFGWIK